MVRVKICGLTRREDALLAASLGASALGFVFYPRSPRFVTPDRAAEIRRALPPFVAAVGVFVDEDPVRVAEIVRLVGLDWVQLHGSEPPEVAAALGPRVIKAFRLRGEDDLRAIEPYRGAVSAVLLDTYVRGVPGGTGRVFDWGLAVRARALGLPVILAGGIRPENVREAVSTVRPWALDVSSGVELCPGRKHPALLRALFARLKGLD